MRDKDKKHASSKPFGGMNPTVFYRKVRDETSRKRTW